MSRYSRNDKRRTFTEQNRMDLLEQDVDELEEDVDVEREKHRIDMAELRAEMQLGFKNTQRILVGLLITVAGSAIVVAMTVGVQHP